MDFLYMMALGAIGGLLWKIVDCLTDIKNQLWQLEQMFHEWRQQ